MPDLFWYIVIAWFVVLLLMMVVIPLWSDINNGRYVCPHSHIRKLTPQEEVLAVRSKNYRQLVCTDCGMLLNGPLELAEDFEH